jgi:hypothetical protein
MQGADVTRVHRVRAYSDHLQPTDSGLEACVDCIQLQMCYSITYEPGDNKISNYTDQMDRQSRMWVPLFVPLCSG